MSNVIQFPGFYNFIEMKFFSLADLRLKIGHTTIQILVFTGAMLCACVGSTQIVDSGYEAPTTPEDHDSSYIETYPELINARLYLSQKSTNFSISNDSADVSLDYEPNTTLNLGIGATVGAFTLNLAYGFKFLNPDEGQGKTRYLDLQSHMYSRKLVIDFFGQFYKGLYLDNTRDLAPDYEDPYYVRPDIYEQIFGLTALYVFNNRKYSYRAPLVQNERQLKSCGSFLAGLEAYYGLVQGDSALVPQFLDHSGAFADMAGIDRLVFFKAGPSVGYAYTLVVAQKFFAMASLTINIGMGVNNSYQPEAGTRSDFQTDVGAFGRFALGYNDSNWYLGLSAVHNEIVTSNEARVMAANYGIGNVRLNFVKRFAAGPKLKPILDKIP